MDAAQYAPAALLRPTLPLLQPDRGAPGAGDLVAASEPDARVRGNVAQELLEAGDAAGAADDAQVQPDRHHARRARALFVKAVEGGAAVAGGNLRAEQTAGGEKKPIV